MSKIPAYLAIKNAILAKIHAGDWSVGTAIPTEIALTQEFGVSRMTVNRALKELTNEKVLERRQGSGTFVAQQKFNHTFVEIRNIAHDILAQKKTYHPQVLTETNISHDQLPPSAQAVFHQDQTLYQVDIVHFGDGIPLQFERRFVDLGIVPAFEHQDFHKINTSDYLIKHVPLVRGRYFIEAKPCPADIAHGLSCQPDAPTLLLSRYTYSGDKVVTFVQMWHDGDSFAFNGDLR